MEKNIKDYLHLYLGCECQKMGQPDASLIFKLTGISYDDTQNIWWAYFAATEEMYAHIDDVFPILRPLSDMTEEEVRDIVNILLRKPKENLKIEWTPDRSYVSVRYGQWLPQTDYDKEGWESCDLAICISSDFTIYNHAYYKKGNGTGVSNEPLYHQHDATKYLLSKHFDLFGLIEAGLAIDKTKI